MIKYQTKFCLLLIITLLLSSCGKKLQNVTDDVTIVGEDKGLRWGTAIMKESSQQYTNFGTGGHSYSMAIPGKTGYLYGKYDESMRKTALFANVVNDSSCPGNHTVYKGFNSLAQLNNVSNLSFQEVKSIEFGVPDSFCYSGLIVFQQDGFYGVIEPVKMQGNNLKVRWWVGEKEVTDFSKAPANF